MQGTRDGSQTIHEYFVFENHGAVALTLWPLRGSNEILEGQFSNQF